MSILLPNEIPAERLQQYQLQSQPFTAEPATTQLYISAANSMLISAIQAELRNTHTEILIIKGEEGIGKTCLAKYLHSNKQYTTYINHAERRTGISSLLKSIVNTHSAQDDPQELAKLAAIALFHILKNGQQPVLLIDDAHLLREQVLQTLLRFMQAVANQQIGKLKIILLGKKDIEKSISQLPEALLNSQSIYTALLRPLNSHDIKAYLDHRIQYAGGKKNPFDNKDIEQIVKNSGGIPGKIDTLAAKLLSGEKNLSEKTRKLLRWSGYTTATIIFLALLSRSLFFTPADTSEAPPPDNIIENQEAIPINPTSIQTPATTLEIDNPQPVDIEKLHTSITKPHSPTDKPTNEAKLLTKTNNNTLPDNTKPVSNSEDTYFTEVPVDQALAAAPEPTEKNTETTPVLYSHKWLNEQTADHFMLQLIGTWDYNKLTHLADTLQPPCTLAYYRTNLNNRTWHVLLCGTYPDSDSAKAAISQLPDKLRNNQPWPRKLSNIQNQIQQ